MAAVEARSIEVLFAERKARDFAQLAVVESSAPLEHVSAAASLAANDALESCSILLYEPQRVRIEANLMRPGIVILSDVISPGWIATIETFTAETSQKKEVPILRTNRVLRGIELPAGRHTIEYCYQPTSFYRGAFVSSLAWLLVGIVLAVGRCGRRFTCRV